MNFSDNLLKWGVWRRWICELRWDGMHPIENANKEIFFLKFSPNGGIRQAIQYFGVMFLNQLVAQWVQTREG